MQQLSRTQKARPTLYLHTKIEHPKTGKLVWRYIKRTPEHVATHPDAKVFIHERDERGKHKWTLSGADLSDSLSAARTRAQIDSGSARSQPVKNP